MTETEGRNLRTRDWIEFRNKVLDWSWNMLLVCLVFLGCVFGWFLRPPSIQSNKSWTVNHIFVLDGDFLLAVTEMTADHSENTHLLLPSFKRAFLWYLFTSFALEIDLLSGSLHELSSFFCSFFFFTDHTSNYIKKPPVRKNENLKWHC